MTALHHFFDTVLHVVAQIVEAQFIIGAVRDVARVFLLALLIVEPVHDDADRQAQEFVDLPHPFRVALGEVVVDRDDVNAAARQRVEINRKRGNERLAFAGLHLGDFALVQNHAADELNVEVALPQRTLTRLAHSGECRDQNVVEGGPPGQLLFEFISPGTQRLVGELRQFAFQRIDRVDTRPIGADAPVVSRTEQLAGDGANHRVNVLSISECPIGSGSSPLTLVQPAENAALFGLLQGGTERVNTAGDIGGGGFSVNATRSSRGR